MTMVDKEGGKNAQGYDFHQTQDMNTSSILGHLEQSFSKISKKHSDASLNIAALQC